MRARLLFAAMVLLPLVYLNIELIRNGYQPSEAGFNIELAQTTGTLVVEEDEGE